MFSSELKVGVDFDFDRIACFERHCHDLHPTFLEELKAIVRLRRLINPSPEAGLLFLRYKRYLALPSC
jgi:hypothetical protein